MRDTIELAVPEWQDVLEAHQRIRPYTGSIGGRACRGGQRVDWITSISTIGLDPHAGVEPNANITLTKSVSWRRRGLCSSTSPSASIPSQTPEQRE